MLKKKCYEAATIFSKNDIIQEKFIDVYAYGLELLVASILEASAILIISLIFNTFFASVVFLITFCILRGYAGGYHASNHLKCFFVLLFVYLVFLCVRFTMDNNTIGWISIGISLISLIVICAFAPVESENKELLTEQRIRNRKISILIVIIESIMSIGTLACITNHYISFGISYGQLAAASSLIAVKIKNLREV
jgi:Membrane protein putatively involved in post-translational modification of the autoinducing quorum-sensing peptide